MYWLEIVLIFLCAIYFVITIIIHVGLTKSIKIYFHQPTVSILIAARNEEDNLKDCLDSIEKLNYPKDKTEVLIINDNSSDNTKNIAEKYTERLQHFNLLNITKLKYNLSGKMNALCQGINQTSGEIILITDADCEVPSNWVSDLVKYFESDVGMCGGLTVLSKQEYKETAFTRLQALDWIFLQSVASASCHLGLPISILGNNFAFRRKAYEEIGGFQQLGFSVTEDMVLLQAIHKTKNWKIKYPLNNQTQIYSKPVDTIFEFFNQRKRWVLGGRSTGFWGYFISLSSLFTHLIMIVSIFLGSAKLGLLLLLMTLVFDFSILIRILKRINRLELIKMILTFKLYYIVYTFIFSIVLLMGKKIEWKKIRHTV